MILSNLANELRAHGLTVVEVAGWQSRGFLGQDLREVRGILWHHTATNRQRFSGADAPTLQMCIDGRPDVAGPLCNIVFGRNGTVYMVAAGVANHAGAGVAYGIPRDYGNHYLIGIEMESSGIAPWDWTADQLRVAPYLGAALERITGASLQIGHMEYSSQGKIDPAGWPGGMDGLRNQINAVLNGTNNESEFDVDTTAKINAIYDRVFGRDVQRWFNPDSMEVRTEPFAGAIAARSSDVHDVISTNRWIEANTKRILDAIAGIPGISEATIQGLREQLSNELEAATRNLEVTLTVAPQDADAAEQEAAK